jgi:membrane associated rhomboid family serine protease
LIPLKDNIPTGRFPILTVILIAVNVAVFGWQLTLSSSPGSSHDPHVPGLSQSDQSIIDYGAIPYRLTHPGRDCSIGYAPSDPSRQRVFCQGTQGALIAERLAARGLIRITPLDMPPWWVTLFTSMFMHGGFLHIAFNMLFLWIFGNNVEDSMGRPRFLLFYLLAGIAAAYTQALLSPDATQPAIGASGAIAGVLGGYILLHPRARVLTVVFIVFFVTLIEIPAMVMLAIWFALQAIPAVGQVATPDVTGGGGVAYWAHVGGFVFGLAAIKLFANRYRAGAPPTLAGG